MLFQSLIPSATVHNRVTFTYVSSCFFCNNFLLFYIIMSRRLLVLIAWFTTQNQPPGLKKIRMKKLLFVQKQESHWPVNERSQCLTTALHSIETVQRPIRGRCESTFITDLINLLLCPKLCKGWINQYPMDNSINLQSIMHWTINYPTNLWTTRGKWPLDTSTRQHNLGN